jgi:hypothetical protein
LIGLGLGPTLVALLVDFHFKDTLTVGKALAIVLCATWLLAVTIMVTGIRPYLRRQQQISAGQL